MMKILYKPTFSKDSITGVLVCAAVRSSQNQSPVHNSKFMKSDIDNLTNLC